MKFFVISLLLSCNLSFSQTIYESIESEALGTTRELKIQLPRNYEANEDQAYPLIIVFDGDYLFEVVAGNVDYYSYWKDMPDALHAILGRILQPYYHGSTDWPWWVV